MTTFSPLMQEVGSTLKDDPRFTVSRHDNTLYLNRWLKDPQTGRKRWTLNSYAIVFHVQRLCIDESATWVLDPLAVDIETSRAAKVPAKLWDMPCPAHIAMSPGYQRVWVNNLDEFKVVLEAILEGVGTDGETP